MTRKEKAYAWMDKQIEACNIQNMPFDHKDSFFIRNASATGSRVHVYNVDNLCNVIGVEYTVEPHSDEYNSHYFMYKGYKFFGLVERYENERE